SSNGNRDPTESTVRWTLRETTGTTWALTAFGPRPSSAARPRAQPPAAVKATANARANPLEGRFAIGDPKSSGFGVSAPDTGGSVRGQDAVVVLDEPVHGGGSSVRGRVRAAELLSPPVVRLEVEDGPVARGAGNAPGPRPELLGRIVRRHLGELLRIHVPSRAEGEEHVAAVGLALGREALGRAAGRDLHHQVRLFRGRGEDDGSGPIVSPLLEGVRDRARGVEDRARVRLAVLVV